MKDELEDDISFAHLSAEDVDEIIHSVKDQEAVVVGGQALGIWAELLLDEKTVEEVGGPVTSKDMDFFGTRDLAKVIADQLGGKVMYPDPGDAGTPQSAIVLYEREGRTIQIDIMGSLAGLSNAEVMKEYMEIGYGEGDDESVIKILSPFHVLKTRVSGIVTLRRRDPSAIRQMRIAPHVLVAFIVWRLNTMSSKEAQEDEEVFKSAREEAQSCIRGMIHLGSSSELDGIYLAYGVDLLQHALSLVDHPAWHEKFAEHQIRKRALVGKEERECRIAERERKAPGYRSNPFSA